MMLIRGDARALPLAAGCAHSCVTDPPYELGFMGKRWDWTGVAFDVATWSEVYRVLKPGGHLVAFSGSRTSHRMVCAIEDAGFEIRDSLVWLYGQGFPKSKQLGAGWGTALKPGHEPIALARKPFTGSVTANHQQHGVGGLNVDVCRIGSGEGKGIWPVTGRDKKTRVLDDGLKHHAETDTNIGRWPANVLLDADSAALLDEQSGELVAGLHIGSNRDPAANMRGYDDGFNKDTRNIGYADTGGASRFFYVAKPSREERDYGCHHLHASTGGEATDRQDGSAGGARNIHPTVKPVALMRWLVRLVTPVGGIVLDPFMGSGTTGMACRYEHLQFIGIERESEYLVLAEARISAVAPLFSSVVA